MEELLFSFERPGMVTRFCGGIAQLGERLNGIQEVSGSIPLTSTNLTGLRGTNFEVRKDFDSRAKKTGNSLRQD